MGNQKWSNEDIEQFINRLRAKMLGAELVEVDFQNGKLELTPTVDGWRQYMPNNSHTVTIKINGGAMDT